jgi:hypothetical protein
MLRDTEASLSKSSAVTDSPQSQANRIYSVDYALTMPLAVR